MNFERKILSEKPENKTRKDGGRIVAVAGAGVAGMTAAKVLAERGFCPVVFEKQAAAGGQVNWADKPPHKEQLGQIVVSLLKQLENLGVEIRLNTEANVQNLRELNPYAVIVATGSVPLRPQSVSGINLPQVLTVAELFGGREKTENKKVVLVGSGAAGLEVAEFLCVNGNKLTIVEMQDKIGKGVYEELYNRMTARLKEYDICFLPSHKLVKIEGKRVWVEDLHSGGLKPLEADRVVLTMGVCPDNALAKELEPLFERVYTIGDALTPGRIGDAVNSAVQTASALE